ncbi:MAG TPA: outer membrane lipoprotein carrier protein LolA [Bryobacteraceae bacterium]|nr:outer membrane lipoprotein carrier protein LolA [Bryobacteraceae bacterium]
MKSNSGSKASSACTIASATGGAARAGKWIALVLSVTLLPAADIDVSKILKGVEDHYNRIQTLQLNFSESMTNQGRKRTEKGELYLRKPGRMRWQYSNGKLYISDGKYIYSYYPDENRAERMPFKEVDDMRAPLAFLLGRLNFQDDFRQFTSQLDRENTFIKAIPKSDKMPYSEVTFLVSPDSVIHWLSVKGQDGTVLEFVFENEKRNPPVADTMFKFAPPPGVEFVKSGQ